MQTMNIEAGSVELLGLFVPTISVNDEIRYFMVPAGQPQHVTFGSGLEARQYAEQRVADLHRTVMLFVQESGFITLAPAHPAV